jgi:protein arginine kinase
MVVNMLPDKLPQWLIDDAPEGAAAVLCQCSLARNLSDFPFPARCTEDEKRVIEARVLGVLDGLNLLSTGHYYSLPDLTSRERRFLAERRLITFELLTARGPRGVYLSEDQSLSIMINALDHLCVRVLKPGLQFQEAWAQLNLVDDTLSGVLDYAFDDRLGFLTASLGNVGTGLKAGALMHLPALGLTGKINERAEGAAAQRLVLTGMRAGALDEQTDPEALRRGALQAPVTVENNREQSLYTDMDGALSCPLNETVGDLYLLVNRGTLGQSEEETIFLVRHAAGEILSEEREARTKLLRDSLRGIEDQVGRARGLAGGARLLGFSEALSLLSSLRLGVEAGLLNDVGMHQINELLLASQAAHLEVARGHDCDALALSMDRADLFRRVVAGC